MEIQRLQGELLMSRGIGRAGAPQRGFTMIELIVAIVVMSIISIGLVRFILDSVTGYTAAASRNQLSAAGRVAIDKISMELRNALPNSVRLTPAHTSASPAVLGGLAQAGDQCLEFVEVVAASIYRGAAFRPDAADTGFEAVNFVPDRTGAAGLYASIYPVGPAELYGADFTPPTTEAIVAVTVADADGGDGVVELSHAAHRFKRRSRVERVFLSHQPVSYCVSGDRLYRYQDYGFHAVQPRPADIGGGCAAGFCLPSATPGRVLIATHVDNAALTDAGSQAFDQFPASRRRNAVVQLELNFSQDGDAVLLNHEVLLHNVP